jgi:catechol 2,3-dioxygenase-like lactoylglutathione lyase family enzyme
MQQPSVISSIGHVAIRVRDLDEAVRDATDFIGLRVSERVDDTVYLTHGAPHHSLQYIAADEDAVDHVALEANGPAALAEIRDRVDAAGFEIVSDEPLDAGIEDGFAFVGHEDFVYEIYIGMAEDEPPCHAVGVGPTRFGHYTFNPKDPAAASRFLQDVLDFRVSDIIDGGVGEFLRCNVDHHGIAVVKGEGTLHHHAWEVRSIADLAKIGDLLDDDGRAIIWGPVRHGIGRNIAAYYPQACGVVVEMYADMERIYDEAGFETRTWSTADHRWFSLWGTHRPGMFRDYGLRPAARVAAA